MSDLISVDCLDSKLRSDQWYGFNSCLAGSIVDHIYAKYQDDEGCKGFKRKFQRMGKYKGNKHAELIFLWMAVVGLKVSTYEKKGTSTELQSLHQSNVLEKIKSKSEFHIHLTDLRDFLLEYGWPLPSYWFRDYLFSTDKAKEQSVEGEFDKWRGIAVEISKLEAEIEDWEQLSAPTTTEQKISCREEIEQLKAKKRDIECQVEGSGLVLYREAVCAKNAMNMLQERLGATLEELAVWVFLEPELGGIIAYCDKPSNETYDLPRFRFSIGDDKGDQYLDQLMRCWFNGDEIANFQPQERYISGRDLVDRWSEVSGIRVEAYIREKIHNDLLSEIHPAYGMTQWSDPGSAFLPLPEYGMFPLSGIKEIEAEEFSEKDMEKIQAKALSKTQISSVEDTSIQQAKEKASSDDSVSPSKETSAYKFDGPIQQYREYVLSMWIDSRSDKEMNELFCNYQKFSEGRNSVLFFKKNTFRRDSLWDTLKEYAKKSFDKAEYKFMNNMGDFYKYQNLVVFNERGFKNKNKEN